MTGFRHAVTNNKRLDIEREPETACSSSGRNPKKEPGFSRTTNRRYVLRNHLRSRLRQKLGRNKEQRNKEQ